MVPYNSKKAQPYFRGLKTPKRCVFRRRKSPKSPRDSISSKASIQHIMGLSCAKLSRTTVILVHIDLVMKLCPMADLNSSICLWFSSRKVCFSLFVFHQRLSSLQHYVNFQSRSSIESCLPPKLIFHQILYFNHSFHFRPEMSLQECPWGR